METTIVLAMHGAPPNDFPRPELGEFFGLHHRLQQGGGPERAALQERYAELEARMRAWPRSAQNDPYHAAAHALAAQLRLAAGHEVIVAFNEFCSPTLDDALDQAAARGSKRIVVVTPMMTRGGGHSEEDIPAAVRRAQERHPDAQVLYAWPFEVEEIAQFLSVQMRRFLERS